VPAHLPRLLRRLQQCSALQQQLLVAPSRSQLHPSLNIAKQDSAASYAASALSVSLHCCGRASGHKVGSFECLLVRGKRGLSLWPEESQGAAKGEKKFNRTSVERQEMNRFPVSEQNGTQE
jgi:hypothetical protein